MAFDAIFSKFVINELKTQIINCRIDKIYQPTKETLVFNLRKSGFKGNLFISANPSSARFHLSDKTVENPEKPPMLCMLFRKKLTGGLITDIFQDGLERICNLIISASNDFGDTVEYVLKIEIMGRNSNIILVDNNNKIIDCVKRTDATNTVRILLPGVKYIEPPKSERYDFLKDGPKNIIEKLNENPEHTITKALQNSLLGISPIAAREINHKLNLNDKIVKDLDQTEKEKINNFFDTLYSSIINNEYTPVIVSDSNGKNVEFSFMKIEQYGKDFKLTEFNSSNELLDAYYYEKNRQLSIEAERATLLKACKKTLSRIIRKTEYRQNELAATENCEQKRIYGELVKANIHQIEKGASECKVTNFDDENMAEIKILLNPKLSPALNAQKYFNEYRKACNAKQFLANLITESQNEAVYMNSVIYELENAVTISDIKEIKNELVQSGYIKSNSKPSKKKNDSKGNFSKILEFQSDEGYKILVGRNNRQNDHVTFESASKNDIWLHIKNRSGSHVIIKCDGKTPSEKTVTFAAILAATYSSAGKNDVAAAVDYCRAKYVKKIPNSAPGMVTYTNFETAFVKPDLKYKVTSD